MEASYWDRITKNRAINRRRLLGAASTGLAGAALLAACGSDDESSEESTAERTDVYSPSEGSPTPGGRFTFTSVTNRNFNALSDWTEGNVLGGNLVYDRPLTAREDSRRFVLEAMESIEQPDPLRAVMKLKPGQTFQDFAPVNGRAVKASDIEATQNYIKASPQAFDRTFVVNYLDRMEVTDDRTITFHLKKPMGYLFNMSFLGRGTGQPIIPGETLSPDLNTNKPIGSGPYSADTLQLSVSQVYKKNPKFRDASKNMPYIAEREYKFITDPVASEAAFRGGQLDWLMYTSSNVTNTLERDLAQAGRARIFRIPGIDDGVIRWNMQKTDNPWRQDVRIREAIWRLTNRQQLLELGQNNNGVMTFGLVPAALKQYWPDQKLVDPYFQEDVAKAQQLLKAANWNPDREVLLIASSAGQDNLIVYQQQMLRGGIKSRIDNYTGLGQKLARIAEGNWDVFDDNTPGSGDPYISMRHQHSDSWSDIYRGFALYDKNLDAMIEKSEQTLDVEENMKLVKDIQLEAMKQFTLSMIMYTLNRNYSLQNRVQNFELTLALPNPQHEAWLKA